MDGEKETKELMIMNEKNILQEKLMFLFWQTKFGSIYKSTSTDLH